MVVNLSIVKIVVLFVVVVVVESVVLAATGVY